MKTRFIANTAEEAQRIFGKTFYEESLPATQTELDERVQLSAFVRNYALAASCTFPVQVDIPPRDQRPDFKVTFGSNAVGIETSKIANWELEEVRSIQQKRKLGTIEISSLLQQKSKRSRDQKIADCTGLPVFIFGDPDQMKREERFWLQQTQSIISRKHSKTKEATFTHHAATWLLLWDKLSYEGELEPRIKHLADWLTPYWQDDFFEKIIIQQQHSERFFILSRSDIEILQREAVFPATEFSLPEDHCLGI